jgi:hypothetical protein
VPHRKGGEGRPFFFSLFLSLSFPLFPSLSFSPSPFSLPPSSLSLIISTFLFLSAAPASEGRRRRRGGAQGTRQSRERGRERGGREGVKETENEREGEGEEERGCAPSEPRKAPCFTLSQGSLSHSLSFLPRFYIPAHLCPLSSPLPSAIRRSIGSQSLSSLSLSLPPSLAPSLSPSLPLSLSLPSSLAPSLPPSLSPHSLGPASVSASLIPRRRCPADTAASHVPCSSESRPSLIRVARDRPRPPASGHEARGAVRVAARAHSESLILQYTTCSTRLAVSRGWLPYHWKCRRRCPGRGACPCAPSESLHVHIPSRCMCIIRVAGRTCRAT